MPELNTDPRKIIHVDMDAFYASVEQRDHPALRGRPVIVGGDPDSRGVVAACSYEARAFGVRSAMSTAKAKRLCPNGVFVHPRFSAYEEASQKIREIFHEVTDLVEPLSLDEAYLDVTENKWNEPLAGKIAIRIKREIKHRLELTASAGVASTLFLAKIASDYRKPDGLTIIPPEEALDFIAPLPVSKIWGVGPATEAALLRIGVRTAGELRELSPASVQAALGSNGMFLYELAHGIDMRRVDPIWERKSYGAERTFEKDMTSITTLESEIRELCVEISDALLEENLRARTITLKIRYGNFETITRSITLQRPLDSAERIFQEAIKLLHEKTEAGIRPVRLAGISASHLVGRAGPEQLWLELPEFL
ncbi:MAG: DNA polymerase IV [Bdellovibrionales bacterium]|nr:DNA polymerase IV [Bdellovibrionales bacterium]